MHFKKFEYLCEFELIFGKALALNQGPRTDVLMKKTQGRKSRDTVPLKRPSVDHNLCAMDKSVIHTGRSCVRIYVDDGFFRSFYVDDVIFRHPHVVVLRHTCFFCNSVLVFLA
jgi:hypothetical protein